MQKQFSGLFASPMKPSARWAVITILTAVLVAIVGGACLAYAFGVSKGSVMATYKDKDFGISFKYPVYDRVTKQNDPVFKDRLVVNALTSDTNTSYYQSKQSSDSKSEVHMTVYKEDPGLAGYTYTKEHCVKGESRTSDYEDGGTSTTKFLKASFRETEINGHNAVICSTLTSDKSTFVSGDKLEFFNRTDQILFYGSNQTFNVQIDLFNISATDKEQAIIDQIIGSLNIYE